MDTATLWFIIGIAGTVILICFSIIAFFLSRIVSDVKTCVEENGKNKGRIELVEQQQANDVRRIEQMTQMEIKVMSGKIGDLSDNVKLMSEIFMQNMVNNKNGNGGE